MKTVCQENMCVGCFACIAGCPKNAIQLLDNVDSLNAVIGADCINCGSCLKVCQQNNKIIGNRPISWMQGWSKELNTRLNSASGGVATEITEAFIEFGGVVYSCVFEDGIFQIIRIDNNENCRKLSGSKYVKSNPEKLYTGVKADLFQGNKVLVIGLPCQIAGLQLFLKGQYEELLYTVDIICHGTSSVKLLQNYLVQYGINLIDCEDIRFRTKESMSSQKPNYQALIHEGVTDCYSIGFQHGLLFTENCYQCNYAAIERISDITLGDSWGSELSESEKEKGISLILCQTEKGKKLIDLASIEKYQVNLENALRANEQLNHPAVAPENRDLFFKLIKKGIPFNKAIRKTLLVEFYRQVVKKMMLLLHVLHPKGITYQITYKGKDRM